MFGKLTVTQKVLTYAVLILLAIPALMPVFWMISTSLKTDAQVFAQGGNGAPPVTLASLIPHPATLQNYPAALKAVPFLLYARNTMFLVVANIFAAVLSSSIVAHGFARCKVPLGTGLFVFMLSTMALPGQVTMVPNFALFSHLGWYGTYLPLTIPAFFGSPYYIFLLTQFMKTLPMDIYESGRIDGMSEWQLFLKVTVPLSKPALATCALFQFVGTWNDFFGPLLYINDPSKYTVAYGLQQFVSRNGGQYLLLMAASTLFVVPVLLVFILAQRTFIEGIATTGGKN